MPYDHLLSRFIAVDRKRRSMSDEKCEICARIECAGSAGSWRAPPARSPARNKRCFLACARSLTSSQSWAGGQATANELRRVERVLERMKRPSARRRPRRPTPPARWASMAILAPSVHRYHRTDPADASAPPHSLLSRNRAFAGATGNQATGRRTRPKFGDRAKEGRLLVCRLACQRRGRQF